MKKNHLKLTALLASLFLTVAAAMAQTSTVNGVVRMEIPVKEGKIIINMPDDIRAGEQISGTVSAEPKGDSEKERNRNKAALSTYKVTVARMQFSPLTAGLLPMNFTAENGLMVSVTDKKLAEITNFPVQVTNSPAPASTGMNVPPFALIGAPVRISGNFDGNMSNTQVTMDGKPTEILAESPRQTIFNMPSTESGSHAINVNENGKSTERKISAVNLELSAAKTNLSRGEKTQLKVEISGLQGLSSPAKITLINTNPSAINLAGGNTQTIPVNPSQVSSNGTYSQSFTAQGLASGPFTVNAGLELPQTGVQVNTGTKPVLLSPADGTVFNNKKDSQPTFNWAPASPIPAVPIQYRIRIVPVYPGQSTGVAFRTNQPLVDSNIINTSFQWNVIDSLWGSGKQFFWGISATDKNGTPLFPSDELIRRCKFSTEKNKDTVKTTPIEMTRLDLSSNPSPFVPKEKNNCDKKLADLEAARAALKNAQQSQVAAQKAMDDWNKQHGTEFDYLNSNMGNLQNAALAAAKAEADATKELLDAMKKGLESNKGLNDGLAFAKDQLKESLDHYTEVYPGIFVYSYNPFNHDPKNAWDRYAKREVERKLSDNKNISNLVKNYNNAVANKAAADQKLNDANARREALNNQRTPLGMALNAANATLTHAIADLDAKEYAYNKCVKSNN